MISGSPSLSVWALSAPHPTEFSSYLEEYASEYVFYGSGKIALRDGIGAVAHAGDHVLVPSYLPDAVVEPIREIGLEPRFYAITESLGPDLADLESRLEYSTAAVMTVNYFGFPQPNLEDVAKLVAEYDCYHVDDNAHSPLSMADGQLLGTRGEIGITSLWKQFPVPDGAVLYLNDSRIEKRFTPSRYAGVSSRPGLSDFEFLVKSIAYDLADRNEYVRRTIDTVVASGGLDTPAESPQKRYEREKSRMSKLSHRVVTDADPRSIRERRRANYDAWRRVLEPRADVEPVFDSLPEGICPQVFPVRVSSATAFLSALEREDVDGAHTWPRLSASVRNDPRYETANHLSRTTVVLPVHQHLEPAEIESVRLEETRARRSPRVHSFGDR